MPEISRFFGIIIAIFFDDHAPPHFHVRYGEMRAAVSIQTLTIIEGKLSPHVRGLVTKWAAIHQTELEEDWNLAKDGKLPKAIKPLE